MPRFALALLALTVAAPVFSAEPAADGKPRLMRPEPAPASESLRLPARTAPAEQAYVYSRATGVLAERRADIGDRVKAGELLAVVAAPEADRAVDKARAALAEAEARADLARATLRRTRALTAKGVISGEEADVGEANAKTAGAELLAAEAGLRRLEQLQSFQRITAPFDGIVANRQFDRGELIQGDSAANARWLFQVVRVNELRVLVDASPAAALNLRPGQAASVEFTELPGRKFAATVARTAGIIDPAAGTMRVELLLPNPDFAIPAGLNGVVLFSTPGAVARLRVPVNAIVVRDGRPMVAQVRDGRVAFTAVVTGRNFGTRIEILDGLSADASFIVNPNALLQDGQAVP
jgi:membrane fusion protein (multidrug efflux system)